jgi:hypothetical protein
LRIFEVVYTTSKEIKKSNPRRYDSSPYRRALATPLAITNAYPTPNCPIIPNGIPAAPSDWL